MKPTYTESWRNCRELARHMWRFYCYNRSPTVDEMSDASYQAWAACNTVWGRLRPSEQEIVDMYHKAPKCCQQNAVNRYARSKGITTEYILSVINNAWKEAAIERGIADREERNVKP